MASLIRRLPLAGLLLIVPLAALLTAYLALGGPSSAHAAPRADSVHKGLPVSAYHHKWTSYPNPPLPRSGPPNICGPWSAANSEQVRAIHARHGALESCLLVGHYWVVTTQNVTGPAQIGILDCSPADSTCMNGWRAKNLTTFAWHVAPPSVTYLKIALVHGHSLVILTNDGQWTFNVDMAAFARMSSSGGAQ
jgi:hypothetical protein